MANNSSKAADSYRRRNPGPLFQASGASSNTPIDRDQLRIEQLIKMGIDAYQSRRLDDAAAYLSNALSMQPNHPLANNCLGIVRRSQGNVAAAISCYERALQAHPQYAEAHNNLGVAFEATGEFNRAISAYESALRNKSNNPAARNNLANVLTKTNRPREAIEHLREALKLQPGFAAAHNNLGLALTHVGQAADAERCFRQAITIQPTFPEAYVNLGNVLRAANKLDAAGECYQLALQQNPGFVSAQIGIGNVLYDQGQSQAALAAYETALRLQPHSAEAQFGLGNALSSLDDNAAIAAWRRALELRPDYAEAHSNLGTLYQRQGHAVLAEKAFLEAVKYKPDLLAAHNNLANLYRYQDRMDLAAQSYNEIIKRQGAKPLSSLRLSTLCPAVWNSLPEMTEYTERVQREWSGLRGVQPYQDLSDLLAVANEPPYSLQFLHTNIRPLKEAYANIFRYTGPTYKAPPAQEQIRLGCVVTPLHEAAFLRLIWHTLKRLSKEEFQLTIVCTSGSASLLRRSIRPDEAQIVEFPEQPHKVLHVIREQRLDILYYFELCTDTLNYFLPFFRLAPVQVTSWGIQVTSGIPNIDAYLSSSLIEPDNAQEHYSERLYLSKSLLTYLPVVDVTTSGKSREGFGLSDSQHVYFCVQNLGKFHPEFDAPLAEILRHDPKGVIVTTRDQHGYAAQKLRQRFARVMPDVADRILILPRQSFQDYFDLISVSDVMLDPIHFAGVTTTYDCFSKNKPIVTWPSAYHRGRYTLGCYRRMGILDCVAGSAEEYVRIATRLAGEPDYRKHISDRIRESRWRIFEDQEAISEHERLFRELLNRSRHE